MSRACVRFRYVCCAFWLLTAVLWVDPAKANADQQLTKGCTVLQAENFIAFPSELGYNQLSSAFVLKDNGWFQPGLYGMALFQMTDGYWYIGKNPPLQVGDELDLESVFGYSTKEALFPARLANATIKVPPTLPPSFGWKSIKSSGLEVAELKASFRCMCNKKENISGCTTSAVIPMIVATTVGISAFICLLVCALLGYRRFRHHFHLEHVTHSYVIDLEAGQISSPASPENKICPKERAERALKIIETANEGMLWVGYVKPAPHLHTGSEEKFAALRWIKSAEIKKCENEDGGEEHPLCCVCFDNAPSCKLMPCQHEEFCAPCIIENACRWCTREAPECPVCRTPFDTIMLPLPPESHSSAEPCSDEEQHHATTSTPSDPSCSTLLPLAARQRGPIVVLSCIHEGEIMTDVPHGNDPGSPVGHVVPVAYSLSTTVNIGHSVNVPQPELNRDRFPVMSSPASGQGQLRGDIVMFDSDALDNFYGTQSASSGSFNAHSQPDSAEQFSPDVGHGTSFRSDSGLGAVIPLSVPLTIVTPSPPSLLNTPTTSAAEQPDIPVNRARLATVRL